MAAGVAAVPSGVTAAAFGNIAFAALGGAGATATGATAAGVVKPEAG
jgi:hypothetical protein